MPRNYFEVGTFYPQTSCSFEGGAGGAFTQHAGIMARPGIHPVLRRATVVLANGASVQVMTTVKKFRGIIKPQTDQTNHHLWTGKKKELENKGQIAKFNVRFEEMSTVKAKEAMEAANEAAKTAEKK